MLLMGYQQIKSEFPNYRFVQKPHSEYKITISYLLVVLTALIVKGWVLRRYTEWNKQDFIYQITQM